MYPGGKAGQPITKLPDVGKGTGSLGELVNTYIQKNTICPTNKGKYYYGQVRSIRYWIYCPAAKAMGKTPAHRTTTGKTGGPILDSIYGIDDNSQYAFKEFFLLIKVNKNEIDFRGHFIKNWV